jgi:hypothetical protein
MSVDLIATDQWLLDHSSSFIQHSIFYGLIQHSFVGLVSDLQTCDTDESSKKHVMRSLDSVQTHS